MLLGKVVHRSTAVATIWVKLLHCLRVGCLSCEFSFINNRIFGGLANQFIEEFVRDQRCDTVNKLLGHSSGLFGVGAGRRRKRAGVGTQAGR